jgi:glucose 1-dehydrogenase
MTKELEGRVAVITGASRGLGLAIASAYVRAGARVVLGSRSSDGIASAISTLKNLGGSAVGRSTDVSEAEEVHGLLDLALREFGRMDIWVNNAALSSPYGGTIQISQDSFTRTLRTNIFGTYFGSIAAVRHFTEQGRGKLINVTGAGAKRPVPYQNAYAASKAWIRNFTLALADETGGTGVEVFVFNPGLMKTDLVTTPQVVRGFEERVKRLGPILSIIGSPPEVPARRAVWLASAATDGRSGLEVGMTSRLGASWSFLAEGARRLIGQPTPPTEISIESIPPAWSGTEQPGEDRG